MIFLKILVISAYNPFQLGSGPASGLYYLSRALAEIGCEVHILTPKTEKEAEIDNNVFIHYFEKPFGINFLGKSWLSFGAFSVKKVKELCRLNKIDIIQSRSPSSFGYALTKEIKIPFLVSVHGVSFQEIGSYFKVPIKFTDKSTFLDAALVQPMWAFLTNLEYKHSDKLIAVSKSVADEITRYYHIKNDKISVIHNGVSVIKENIDEQENLLFSAGRLIWRKGFTYLIQALPKILKEHPKTKLVIAGEGKFKSKLKDYSKKLNVEHAVYFCGNLSKKEMFSMYARAQIYVQPSLYEPLGNTIMEAMALEKPVIATKVGGIPEIITTQKNGLLVNPHNSNQLAEAINMLLSDSSYRKKLSHNAKLNMDKNFSWQLIARKTLALYEQSLLKYR